MGHPLLAQLDQGIDARRRGFGPVVVGIVQVEDVDVVESQPLEARIDRVEDPVATEVPFAAGRGWNDESVVVQLAGPLGRGDEQPTDLRRDDVVIAGKSRDRPPQPRLGEPEAVVGCAVEVPDSPAPRSIGRIGRRRIRGLTEQVAERRGTESQLRERRSSAQCSRTDPGLLEL